MSEARRRVFTDSDMDTVFATAICNWCKRPIYQSAQLAPWRHEATHSQECKFFAEPVAAPGREKEGS